MFEICGREPLIEVALAVEQAALSDEYFIKRKLYPNVDFYSGIIYKAMGFPTDFFPVLFAIPRVAGWLAHWVESCQDPDTKIWRPRQVYDGEDKRGYMPIEHRQQVSNVELRIHQVSQVACARIQCLASAFIPSSWSGI